MGRNQSGKRQSKNMSQWAIRNQYAKGIWNQRELIPTGDSRNAYKAERRRDDRVQYEI